MVLAFIEMFCRLSKDYTQKCDIHNLERLCKLRSSLTKFGLKLSPGQLGVNLLLDTEPGRDEYKCGSGYLCERICLCRL